MTELHELYQLKDTEWAKLVAIPIEERQAYRKEHATEEDPWIDMPEVKAILDRCKELADQIAPLEKDFEKDMSEALGARLKTDDKFAQRCYASLCNIDWEHEDGSRYSCTWRSAGGLIAEIRNRGEDYMDFYCSGIWGDEYQDAGDYLHEGEVDKDMGDIMGKLGWFYKEM